VPWLERAGAGWLGFCLAVTPSCKSDAERAELAEVAHLVEHIDRLRRADNADKAPLLGALSAAECRGADACALKDLCVRAYRLHQDALDAIAAAKRRASGDPTALDDVAKAHEASRLSAIEGDLSEAKVLAERCANEQVRVMRSKLM
jgi:hypothetical protein